MEHIAFGGAYNEALGIVLLSDPDAMVPAALTAENCAEWDVAPSAILDVAITVGHFAASLAAHSAAAALLVPVAQVLALFVSFFEAFLVHNGHTAAAQKEESVQAAAEDLMQFEDLDNVLAVEKLDPETVLAAEITDSCIVVDTVKHPQAVHAAQ